MRAVLCGLAAVCLSLQPEPTCAQTAVLPPPSNDTAGDAGQMIYVDPETGQITTPPESEPGSKAKGGSAAAATADLVEEPLPSGGFKLDTEGKFRVPLTATTNAEGELVIQHGESSDAEQR